MSSNSQLLLPRPNEALVLRDEDSSNNVAIEFQNVTKSYKLFKNDRAGIINMV